MKAIIPAAGLGTRLRPLTFARPKPVLRVAGQPIICHALRTLSDAGIVDVGIVVSGLTHRAIESVVQGVEGVNITFIHQDEMLGLGHAVKMARSWVGQDDFCVYLGDNLFEHGVGSFIEAFHARRAEAVVALVEVEDPSAFGVAVLGDGGRITRLVEKPRVPPSNLAVAGMYCFSPAIFDVLETLAPSPRGEYEITDAIAGLIEGRGGVYGERVTGWWKDTGRPQDLIDANRLLLEPLRTCVLGDVTGSTLTGRVVVELGAEVRGSTIMGPVLIAAGARVENAYLGPFTSVGRGSVIRNTEIECSVIDENAEVRDVNARLQGCLIGVGARVIGHGSIPRVHRFTLSDASVLELGC
ncbi:glucose-1-phosphate thymidylyltransferase [Deinococcus sp. YIM 134068]|uniref:glucose-1-phosphate thymidylyltransferase n=1 Tax=Deinococcus lichenicola TaxID=3118910 RepID=UPI002F93A171